MRSDLQERFEPVLWRVLSDKHAYRICELFAGESLDLRSVTEARQHEQRMGFLA